MDIIFGKSYQTGFSLKFLSKEKSFSLKFIEKKQSNCICIHASEFLWQEVTFLTLYHSPIFQRFQKP